MTDLIKIHYHRPMISFVDFEPEDTVLACESGYWIRRELSNIIDKWHLVPDVTRDRKGKIKHPSSQWSAYRTVILDNRFYPEDVVTLRRHLIQGFDEALKLKDDAVEELGEFSNIDPQQQELLAQFLKQTKDTIVSDMERAVGYLLSLEEQLETNPNLWTGETHETH